MRALITRPRENAGPIIRALADRDIDVLQEPLLEVRPTEHDPIDLDGVQAILLTSAVGARELAKAIEERSLPVYCVGDATAATARDAGFAIVESARGDAEALASLVLDRLEPGKGALLHAAGRTIAGDLSGMLGEAGFEVRRVELYSAVPAPALSQDTVEALRAGAVDLALFFSPRTAATFARLAREAELADTCRSVTALCMSPNVAEAASALPWRGIETAPAPEQAAMVDLVDRWIEAQSAGETEAAPEAMPAAPTEEPPPAAARPYPPTPPAPERRFGLLALAVLVLLLFGATAAGGYLLWQGQAELRERLAATPPPAPGSEQAVAALEERLAAVEARLRDELSGIEKRLTARIAGAEQRIEAPADLEDRLAQLEQRLQELPGQPDVEAAVGEVERAIGELGRGSEAIAERLRELEQESGALEQRIEAAIGALEQRLAEVGEAARSAAEDRTPALLVAVGQIRSAVAQGRPFAAPLAELRQLAGDEPRVQEALAGWAGAAETGIPATGELLRRFRAAAGEVLARAEAVSGDGWLDRALDRASSVVRIRRVGEEVPGDTPAAVLARAEAKLSAGDLAGAVAEVERLEGEPAEAFAGWLDQARARLAAEQGIAALERAVVAPAGSAG